MSSSSRKVDRSLPISIHPSPVDSSRDCLAAFQLGSECLQQSLANRMFGKGDVNTKVRRVTLDDNGVEADSSRIAKLDSHLFSTETYYLSLRYTWSSC